MYYQKIKVFRNLFDCNRVKKGSTGHKINNANIVPEYCH